MYCKGQFTDNVGFVCFKNVECTLIKLLWSHERDLFGYCLEWIISLNYDGHVILLFIQEL